MSFIEVACPKCRRKIHAVQKGRDISRTTKICTQCHIRVAFEYKSNKLKFLGTEPVNK